MPDQITAVEDVPSLESLVGDPAQEAKKEAPQTYDNYVEGTDEKQSALSSRDEGEADASEGVDAQIAGLTKELSRVRKDRNASSQEVQELRERLAQVQGTLEGLKTTQAGTNTNTLERFSEDDLVQGQGEWEDAFLEARDMLNQARKDGNSELAGKAEQAVSVARRTLQAIRKELLVRTKEATAAQSRVQSETDKVMAEVGALYTDARENFPELQDKDSDLWQAGKSEYDNHATMMRALGPLGELVAVAMAVAKNPTLVKGAEKSQGRRELLNEIDTKAEKALFRGSPKDKSKGAPDFSRLSPSQFDSMIERIKTGT